MMIIVALALIGVEVIVQPNLLPKKILGHNKVHKNANSEKITPKIIITPTNKSGWTLVAPIRFIKTELLN